MLCFVFFFFYFVFDTTLCLSARTSFSHWLVVSHSLLFSTNLSDWYQSFRLHCLTSIVYNICMYTKPCTLLINKQMNMHDVFIIMISFNDVWDILHLWSQIGPYTFSNHSIQLYLNEKWKENGKEKGTKRNNRNAHTKHIKRTKNVYALESKMENFTIGVWDWGEDEKNLCWRLCQMS